MDEFMATVKECVGTNIECKNLIRKMHSGLQMLNAIRAVFVGTSQSRLQQVENATDNIKALRLGLGQTVADLTQEFGNLVDVRDDCSNDPLTSEHKGFYFMEIMRNTVEKGEIERVFSTALQSLDINQGQRKRYEGIVSIFKASGYR